MTNHDNNALPELPDYADTLQVVDRVLRLIDEKVMLTKAREGRASDRKRAEVAEQAYTLMCGHGKAIRDALCRASAGREAVAMRIVLPRGSASPWEDYDAERAAKLRENGWTVQVAYDFPTAPGLPKQGEIGRESVGDALVEQAENVATIIGGELVVRMSDIRALAKKAEGA